MVITMAKLRMAHASTHGARKAHASRLGQYSVVRYNNHIGTGTYRDCSRRAGRSMQARWWRALHSYERMAKTKYFTLGCNKLLMGVDHKGLLNSKALETIDNPRQRRRHLA